MDVTGYAKYVFGMNIKPCVFQTIIQGKDSIVVAGGLGANNNPIKEVEFLDISFTTPSSSKWKVLGLLQTARFGFPTIGRVLGEKSVKILMIGTQSLAIFAFQALLWWLEAKLTTPMATPWTLTAAAIKLPGPWRSMTSSCTTSESPGALTN